MELYDGTYEHSTLLRIFSLKKESVKGAKKGDWCGKVPLWAIGKLAGVSFQAPQTIEEVGEIEEVSLEGIKALKSLPLPKEDLASLEEIEVKVNEVVKELPPMRPLVMQHYFLPFLKGQEAQANAFASHMATAKQHDPLWLPIEIVRYIKEMVAPSLKPIVK
jgi:hypothetical protein